MTSNNTGWHRVLVSMDDDRHLEMRAWCNRNLGTRGIAWDCRCSTMADGVSVMNLDVWLFPTATKAAWFNMVWG